MQHLNFKILALYGGAIAGVITLFRTITIYGDNHLHPPAALKNRYLLTLSPKIPHCEQVNPLLLKIQQSGIYVNAALLPTTDNPDKVKQLNLSGLLQKKQLNLAGKINRTILCQNSVQAKNQMTPITLRASFTNDKKIIGELLSPQIASQPLNFTAIPQLEQESTSQSGH